jgi:surface carbohydrate biosynthesis protein
MANALTPTLYLSVENKTREFDAKLLVGCAAAEAGLNVVIGQQWLMNANLQHMPPGVVFFKGMNRVQAVNMNKARRFGHTPVANDEEALGLADLDYMVRDVAPETAQACELVFAQGKQQKIGLMTKRRFPDARVRVTGNPRLDLLRPEFAALYAGEAAALREKYGPFILVNTNFGSIYSAWGSLDAYRQVLVNIGWMDPRKPEDVALYEEHVAFDRQNADTIHALIRQLVPHLGDHTIIVRPHPSERLDEWKRLYADHPRVRIIHEGNHMAWILASRVMVHTGCTTGLEAQVAGHPTLSVRAGTSRWRGFYLSNLVNVTADTAEEGVDILRRFLTDEPDLFAKRRPQLMAQMDEHFTGWSGPFAFQRTADTLMTLYEGLEHQMREFEWTGLPGFLRKVNRSAYQKQKLELSIAEVMRRIRVMHGMLGRFGSVTVRELGDSIFLLRCNP